MLAHLNKVPVRTRVSKEDKHQGKMHLLRGNTSKKDIQYLYIFKDLLGFLFYFVVNKWKKRIIYYSYRSEGQGFPSCVCFSFFRVQALIVPSLCDLPPSSTFNLQFLIFPSSFLPRDSVLHYICSTRGSNEIEYTRMKHKKWLESGLVHSSLS